MVTLKNSYLCVFAFAGALLVSSCASKGPGSGGSKGVEMDSSRSVVGGLVTMRGGVDVTADDGSLMAEQLQLGDKIYIVTRPAGGSRPGWVRVSRSSNDTNGFGWVESRAVRTAPNMRKSNSGGSGFATVPPAQSGSFSDDAELMDGVGSGGIDSGALEEFSDSDISGGSLGDTGDNMLDDFDAAPSDQADQIEDAFDVSGDEEVNFDDIFE